MKAELIQKIYELSERAVTEKFPFNFHNELSLSFRRQFSPFVVGLGKPRRSLGACDEQDPVHSFWFSGESDVGARQNIHLPHVFSSQRNPGRGRPEARLAWYYPVPVGFQSSENRGGNNTSAVSRHNICVKWLSNHLVARFTVIRKVVFEWESCFLSENWHRIFLLIGGLSLFITWRA